MIFIVVEENMRIKITSIVKCRWQHEGIQTHYGEHHTTPTIEFNYNLKTLNIIN